MSASSDMEETDNVFDIIGKRFPEMSPSEIEVEFLTLAWIDAVKEKRIIVREEGGLTFVLTDNSYIPDGKRLTSVEFFNEFLGPRLIDSVKAQTVYVVDYGDDGVRFMNKHEMTDEDFFLRSFQTAKATTFIKSLMIDDMESV